MATKTSESDVISVVANLIARAIELISFNGTDASPLLGEISADPNVQRFITSHNVNVLIISWSRRQTNAKLSISTNILDQWRPVCNSVSIAKKESTVITTENVQRAFTIQCCPSSPDIATQFKRSLKCIHIPYFNGKQSQIAQTLTTLYSEIDAFESSSAKEDEQICRISTIDDEIRSVSRQMTALYHCRKHFFC